MGYIFPYVNLDTTPGHQVYVTATTTTHPLFFIGLFKQAPNNSLCDTERCLKGRVNTFLCVRDTLRPRGKPRFYPKLKFPCRSCLPLGLQYKTLSD